MIRVGCWGGARTYLGYGITRPSWVLKRFDRNKHSVSVLVL